MHHDLNTLVGYAVIQYGSAAHGGVMKYVAYGRAQGIH